MIEITKERANQLYGMMLYLVSNGNHEIKMIDCWHKKIASANAQLWQLRAEGRAVAEIDRRGDKYYYQEF